MLELRGLRFSYGSRQVLHGISAKVDSGTLCGLFGPNGCGKTTLFKCCLRLLPVAKGAVHLQNRDVRALPPGGLSRLAAYVPQEHQPPFPFKVKEMVLMGRTPHLNGSLLTIPAVHRQAAREAMERIGIEDLADERYDQLSGGQRQLVLIARAVAQQAPVMFLDEPTSALDFSNQMRIWRILRNLARAGTTIVACSHDPNCLLWFSDRVLVLNRGRVLADGPPELAFTEPVLDVLYQGACAIHRADGVRLVVPRLTREEGQVTPTTPMEGSPVPAGAARDGERP